MSRHLVRTLMNQYLTQPTVFGGIQCRRGTLGNIGASGVPVMHYALGVHPNGTVTGFIEILQAQPGTNDRIVVHLTKGLCHELVLEPKPTLVVTLEGNFTNALPPPAIGTIIEPFHAVMALDANWQGRGSFSYGSVHVNNVPALPHQ